MLSMIRPEQSMMEVSRIDNLRKSAYDNDGNFSMNVTTINDNSLTVEMPVGVSTAKTSARTGIHFYKRSAGAMNDIQNQG